MVKILKPYAPLSQMVEKRNSAGFVDVSAKNFLHAFVPAPLSDRPRVAALQNEHELRVAPYSEDHLRDIYLAARTVAEDTQEMWPTEYDVTGEWKPDNSGKPSKHWQVMVYDVFDGTRRLHFMLNLPGAKEITSFVEIESKKDLSDNPPITLRFGARTHLHSVAQKLILTPTTIQSGYDISLGGRVDGFAKMLGYGELTGNKRMGLGAQILHDLQRKGFDQFQIENLEETDSDLLKPVLADVRLVGTDAIAIRGGRILHKNSKKYPRLHGTANDRTIAIEFGMLDMEQGSSPLDELDIHVMSTNPDATEIMALGRELYFPFWLPVENVIHGR